MVETHVTVNNVKILTAAQKLLLWPVYVAGNMKRTHVFMYATDFNKIWNFSTDFYKSLQRQTSQKSGQWEPR